METCKLLMSLLMISAFTSTHIYNELQNTVYVLLEKNCPKAKYKINWDWLWKHRIIQSSVESISIIGWFIVVVHLQVLDKQKESSPFCCLPTYSDPNLILKNAPIQDVKLECGLKMNATLESSSSACVSSSVNFIDKDYDEKYSSTNFFHGRKINEN